MRVEQVDDLILSVRELLKPHAVSLEQVVLLPLSGVPRAPLCLKRVSRNGGATEEGWIGVGRGHSWTSVSTIGKNCWEYIYDINESRGRLVHLPISIQYVERIKNLTNMLLNFPFLAISCKAVCAVYEFKRYFSLWSFQVHYTTAAAAWSRPPCLLTCITDKTNFVISQRTSRHICFVLVLFGGGAGLRF